jgi:hypothetical protein
MTPAEIEALNDELQSFGAVPWRVVNLRSTHRTLHLLVDAHDARRHLVMTDCTFYSGDLAGTGLLTCARDRGDGNRELVRVSADNLLATGASVTLGAQGPQVAPNFHTALSMLSSILDTASSSGYPADVMLVVKRIVDALADSSSDPTDAVIAMLDALASRFPEYAPALESVEMMRIRVL